MNEASVVMVERERRQEFPGQTRGAEISLHAYATEIRKFAAEIGRHAEQRALHLKHELADIEAPRLSIRANSEPPDTPSEERVTLQIYLVEIVTAASAIS
jgi:hypothetical protein